MIGVDQYGTVYGRLGRHPRAALLARLGRRHAERIYLDTPAGTVHCGYIIAGLWISLYAEWHRPV
jgi:hypothetical protein